MSSQIQLDPRTTPADAPVGAPEREQLDYALRCATLAPSPHNTQPWLFRIDGTAVELLADRSRALPVADPRHRELIMSCGAALFHLRVALRACGRESRIVRGPFGRNPDLLARVELAGRIEPEAADAALLGAIFRRRTNRLAFARDAVPASTGHELALAVLEQGAELVLIRDPEARRRLAALVTEGDRRQRDNGRFRNEAAAWAHADGSADAPARTVDLGTGEAPSASDLADACPAMGVLLTDWEGSPEWLTAGEALAQLLLQAEASGLAASFLNQPIQDNYLRPRLRRALGEHGFPQVLLRLGYPLHTVPATPRRPLEDVVL